MNEANNISLLRKEYKIAIKNFDFDKAEMIDKKIQHLRMQISKSQISNQAKYHEMDEQKEKFDSVSTNKNKETMEQRKQMQQNFHRRFLSLQAAHSRQINDLTSQNASFLNKELQRPIPEAEDLLNHSKVLGNARKYSEARETYNEAQRIKKQILEERRRSCSIDFEKQLRILKKQQEREIELLSDKQKAALQILDQRNEETQNLISLQLKFKEHKASLKKSMI